MKDKYRICFDFDRTLVTDPEVEFDYSTVKPIDQNIELLKKLKNNGHRIIICTARGMNDRWGDIEEGRGIPVSIYEVTFKTLKDFNIPYDEIYFGKPNADFYIDDKAMNPWGEQGVKGKINELANNIPMATNPFDDYF